MTDETGGGDGPGVPRQDEASLQHSEAVLRAILANLPSGVSVRDARTGELVLVNPRGQQILGRLVERLDQLTQYGAVHADGRPYRNEEWPPARAIATGEAVASEDMEFVRPDGTRISLSISSAPIRDAHGRVTMVVTIFHDVTEARRAAAALRASQVRLSKAQEIAHLGSWELDLGSGQLTWSDEVYRIFGVQPQEVPATYQVFLDAVHPDDRAAVDAAYTRSLQEDRDAYDIEHRVVRRASGEIRVVHEKCEHIRDAAGKVVRSVGMVHDITERKRAEDAVREGNRRKDEFLALLSHELRNPLMPIRNSLFVMAKAPPGGEQVRRAQAVAERQVAHLTRLVDDLLDITRIARGKIALRRERVELGELVRRTIEDHRELFAGRGIALAASITTLPLWIEADATRVTQVIGNLLQNAAKFTPEGGRVTAGLEAASGQAVIWVRDTGIGLAPETIARMFEPFAQAESSIDRSRGGLGLGLALVKGLVEQHGGTVEATSGGLGRGSMFTVRLPLEPTATPAPAPGPAGTTGLSRRVLVIEDQRDAAASLSEVLLLLSHQVELAHTGREGLDKARAFHPDVVLCDIGLPDLDGYEVARVLRADPALRQVFLVALTGYALPEDVAKATEAGFNCHLAKPPSIRQIEELLAKVPGRS